MSVSGALQVFGNVELSLKQIHIFFHICSTSLYMFEHCLEIRIALHVININDRHLRKLSQGQFWFLEVIFGTPIDGCGD